MSKKHDQMYYMKKCRDCLLRIQSLKPEDFKAFLILRKKAEKYLAKAKEFEKPPQT